MTLTLILGMAWVLLSIPLAVLIGKCISLGQAGEAARHAASASEPATTAAPLQPDTVDAEDESAASTPVAGAVPAQRQPAIPPVHVS